MPKFATPEFFKSFVAGIPMTAEDVRLYRFILTITPAALLLGFWITHAFGYSLLDPFTPRLILTGYSVAVIVLSFCSDSFKKRMHLPVYIFLLLVYLWLLMLTWLNDFEPVILLWDLMYIFAAFQAFRSMSALISFGIIVVFSMFLAYSTVPEPKITEQFMIYYLAGGLVASSISAWLISIRLKEIRHQRRNTEIMKKARNRLNQAERIAGIGYWEMKRGTEDIFLSPGYRRLLGINNGVEKISLEQFFKCVAPEHREDIIRRVRTKGKWKEETDFKVQHEDGTIIYINSVGASEDSEGRLFGYVIDVTTNRRMLVEKEVLLKEVHHRVKNNLQVILSMIRIQRESVKGNPGDLIDAEARIRTIALIHEELYSRDDLSAVDISRYLKNLIRYLLELYRISGKQIEITTEIPSVVMDIDRLIPCALIVTELVSNAMKHAFSDSDKGKIRIHGSAVDNSLSITVGDDGQGAKPDGQTKRDFSGTVLITSLTEQLKGSLISESNGGYSTTLKMKIRD